MTAERDDSRRLAHLNRVLRAIRNVNQLITHSSSHAELLQGVCNCLTDTRGYYNAWILCFDGNGRLTEVYESGMGSSFSVFRERIRDGSFPLCVKRAHECHGLVQIREPAAECTDCPLSGNYEGRSGMCSCLRYKDRTYGVLGVSIPREFYDDEEEKELFGEVAGDVGYARYALELATQRDELTSSLQQEHHLRDSLMEASPLAITILDTTGAIVQANTRAQQLLGLTLSELTSRTYNGPEWNITNYQGDVFKESELPFQRVMATKSAVFGIQHSIEQPDGRRIHLSINATPLFDAQGQVKYVLCTLEDRTEMVETHQSLSESEEKYRDLFENAPVGIFVTTSDGDVLHVNPEMARMVGASSVQQAVENYTDIAQQLYVDPGRRAEFIDALKREGAVTGFEYQARRIDGSRGWISMNARVRKQRGDGTWVIEGFAVDITEQKRAQRRSEEYHGMLESTLGAVDSLLVVLDKDLRVVLSNWKDHGWVPEAQRTQKPCCYRVLKHRMSACPGCPVLETFRDGESRWYEDRNPVDGREKEISVVPILDHEGRVEYVLENVRDVTEQKRRQRDQTRITNFQLQLLRITREEDVYPLVTRTINDVLGKGVVLATRFNDDNESLRVASYHGLDVSIRKIVDMLGMDPRKTEYKLSDMSAEEVSLFRGGKLSLLPGGIHALSTRKVPKPLCTALEKLLGISHVYTAGFVHGTRHLGGISILTDAAEEAMSHNAFIIEGIVSIASFSIARLRAEKASARSEENLRITLDSIGDAVIATDIQGNVVRMNPVACTLTGFKASDAKGKCLSEVFNIVNAQTGERVQNPVRKVLDSGNVVGLANHTMLIAADGNRYQIADSGAPIRDAEGRISGVVLVFRDVTQEYARAERLRESERKFRNIFHNANDAIYMHCITEDELPGKFVEVNDVACRMLGYTREEFMEMTPRDVDCGSATQRIREIMKSLFSDFSVTFEIRHRAKDGHEIPVEVSAHLMEMEGQLRVLSIARDISEREKAHAQIRENEQRLNLAIDAGGLGMWDWHIPSNEIVLGPLWAQMLGYDLSEIDAEHIQLESLMVDEDLAGVKEKRDAHLRGETEAYAAQFRMRHKSGDIVWIYDKGKVIERDEKGNPVRMCGVHQDISEYKKAENALRENEQRLNLTIEGGELGTWDFHIPSGRVVFNERWADMLGFELDEIDQNLDAWKRLVHPDDFPQAEEKLNAHLYGQAESYEAQFRMKHKSGDWVWISDKGKVIERDAGGQPLRACGTHLDITEQKHLQERLQQAQKMEAVGQLAGGIAHDFNNILGAVIGYADMTREMVGPSSKVYKNQEKILQASDRAKNLVRQILSFSRQSDERLESTSLRPVVKEVIALLKASLPASIHFNSYLKKDAKAVQANPTKIHELLMNCATNAAYAMEQKGELTFSLYSETTDESVQGILGDMPTGEYTVIGVADTGTGIPEAVQKRMFDPFYTNKPVGEGTGMGLAVVFGIMKAHNGNIFVDSAQGKGTLFRFFFPVCEQQPLHTEEENGEIEHGSERILFVDDEAMIRDSATDMLSSLGYSVTACAYPGEIVERVTNDPYCCELLITDQAMPYMTGLELAAKVKEQSPRLPVLLCTGYSNTVNMQHKKPACIDKVLMKPLRKRELGAAVREVLDKRGTKGW